MQAKEYLNRIGRCDAHINSKIAEVEALYAMVTRITPAMKQDVVSGGGSEDKMGNAVARIVDLKEEINREIDTYVDMKREASMLMDKLGNSLHYQVLHKRYILHETMERIAVEMGYTYRNVCYLHGRALQKFQDVLDAHMRENV
jgi:anaerobic ribonucleoside-triphosphate reductase